MKQKKANSNSVKKYRTSQRELFKGTYAFFQVKEDLHKNFKGKKGLVQKIHGVLLLKSGCLDH
jgi:hypothetical protein